MFIIQWCILQVKLLKNRFKEKKKRFLFVNSLRAIVFLMGFSLLYSFLIYMFDFAARKQMVAFDFACIMLSFCLLVFLPLLTYSTIICALSFLFQKEEITFYFGLPISRIQVFTVKFWQIFLQAGWMTFFVIFVFILAMHTHFGLSPLIYLSGTISSVALLLIPVCLGIIVTLAFSCFVPFVRAKGILTVIGLFIGSLLLLIIRLMRPENLATAQGKIRLLTFTENLHKPWMTVLPSEWLTNVFAAHYRRDIGGILFNLSALITIAAILLIITFVLAKVFYPKVWAESIAVPAQGKKGLGWQFILKFFPKDIRIFIQKDLLSFYRDTVERGSLIIFIPMAFIYFYSMRVLKYQFAELHYQGTFPFIFLYLFNFFYSTVILCALSGRWVFPSISAEGNNFKLIKLSPVTLQEFLREKFWLGFLPLLVLGEILVIGSCFLLGFALSYTVIACFIIVILAFVITGIGLIMGTRLADFSIKEPLEFALSFQGFIYLVWCFILTGLIILLMALPLVLFLLKGVNFYFVLSSIIAILGVLFIFYGLYLSYKRAVFSLSKMEI